MRGSEKIRTRPRWLVRYVWTLVVVWTVLVAAVLIWNVLQVKKQTLETARIQARVAYEKDVIYRRWNAQYGGVYVPVTEGTKPNPYLSDINERDITTPSGKMLTLMNPAYMTRQVHELGEQEYGVRGHITSLNPVRPENAPDPWETEALHAFEGGQTEISSVEEMEGEEYMRLMRPLVTEKDCLKCHATQGYQEGDIRGGISVSIPMKPLKTIARVTLLTFGLGHSLLWLMGLGGIVLAIQRLRQKESARKRAEEKLKEYSEQLVRKEKLATLGQLAGGVGHELRNPLGVISNSVYYLKMKLEDADEMALKHLDILKREVERANTIITDLLDFSRTKLPSHEEGDANDIVKNALVNIEMSENISVETQLDETLPRILLDPDQIQQIFQNIISNSVQAMGKGGKLRIETGVKGRFAEVIFEDTGEGIAKENLSKIFEPLFTTRPKGIGLGLAIVKGIVDGHKGRIEVKSEVGKGTTIIVKLPLNGKKGG